MKINHLLIFACVIVAAVQGTKAATASTLETIENGVADGNDGYNLIDPEPSASTVYSFDAHLKNTHDPYAEILKQFSAISNQAFNPKNIVDGYSLVAKGNAVVEFTLKGKKYTRKVIVDKNWIDLSFLEFIDDVVKENGLKGKFYTLMDEGQIIKYVFLTKEQYRYYKSNKLLQFEDDWDLE